MIIAIGDPAGDLKPAIVPAKVRLSFGSFAHQAWPKYRRLVCGWLDSTNPEILVFLWGWWEPSGLDTLTHRPW